MKAKSEKELQAECAHFNQQVPIGATVRFWTEVAGPASGRQLESTVLEPGAYVSADGEAVVNLALDITFGPRVPIPLDRIYRVMPPGNQRRIINFDIAPYLIIAPPNARTRRKDRRQFKVSLTFSIDCGDVKEGASYTAFAESFLLDELSHGGQDITPRLLSMEMLSTHRAPAEGSGS